MTAAQRAAVDTQIRAYDAPETPCRGLSSYRLYPATEWGFDEQGAVAVDFAYLHEDGEGTGLETTVFAADGSVLDTQDFG